MTSLQLITPQFAAEHIAKGTNHHPELLQQVMRPIRVWWVETLAERMRQQEFTPSVTIQIGHLDGAVFILNGNHTLRAIVESGLSQRLPVQHYNFTLEDDIRHFFATTDRGLSRSTSDSIRAYGFLKENSLTQRQADSLVAAVKFIGSGFVAANEINKIVADSIILDEAIQWVPAYHQLTDILSGVGKLKHIISRRRSILSIALVTMRGKPEEAAEFWSRAALGENLLRTDPRFRLYLYLMTTSAPSQMVTPGKIPEGSAIMARKAALLWNKYIKKQPVSSFRYDYDNRKPLTLEGCKHVELPDFLAHLSATRTKSKNKILQVANIAT